MPTVLSPGLYEEFMICAMAFGQVSLASDSGLPPPQSVILHSCSICIHPPVTDGDLRNGIWASFSRKWFGFFSPSVILHSSSKCFHPPVTDGDLSNGIWTSFSRKWFGFPPRQKFCTVPPNAFIHPPLTVIYAMAFGQVSLASDSVFFPFSNIAQLLQMHSFIRHWRWSTQWHLGKFFPQVTRFFPLSEIFHNCSKCIHPPATDAV